MQTSEEFIQVLEKTSDKIWDVPAKDIELSGWTESPKFDDIRKGLLTQSNNRNAKITYIEKKSKNYAKSSSNKVRIPLTYNNNSNHSAIYKPIKPKNFIALIKTCPKPKIENIKNLMEIKRNFHITTISLQMPPIHWRNKSAVVDQRTIKLEHYYNRDYLIIAKSPPIVSGYSATFYHK